MESRTAEKKKKYKKSKRFSSFSLQRNIHLFSYNLQQLSTRFMQCCLCSETLRDKRANAQASNAVLGWLSTKDRSFFCLHQYKPKATTVT